MPTTLISARRTPAPRPWRRLVVGAVIGGGALVLASPRLLDREGPVPGGEIWRSPDPALPDTARVSFRLPPDGPLRGVVEVDLEARDDLGVLAELFIDGAPAPLVVEGAPPALVVEPGRGVAVLRLRLDTTGWTDGLHRVEVTLRDRAWPPNTTTITREIESDNTAPTLTLARSSRSVGQGRTLGVYVRGSEPLVAPVVTLEGERSADRGESRELLSLPTVMVEPTILRALTGIPVQAEPGARALRVTVRDAAGNLATLDAEVTVTATTFRAGGFVELTEDQEDARKDRDQGRQANEKRGAAYTTAVDSPLPGTFVLPVEAPFSSRFGKERGYPDGSKRHHLGTDFAASLGTPVGAAADGVVTLAEPLHLYGNSVIVGHGAGVSTSYNHLSRIDVPVGERVTMGQTLGLVGSTGQSTGAHLHWGMVVGGVAVAAEEWISRRFELPLPGDFGEPLPR